MRQLRIRIFLLASVLFHRRKEPRVHIGVLHPPTGNDGISLRKVARAAVDAMNIFVQLRAVRKKNMIQNNFFNKRNKTVTKIYFKLNWALRVFLKLHVSRECSAISTPRLVPHVT